MRRLPPEFRPYAWAISTAEAARVAGIEPDEVLRFDANTAPRPPEGVDAKHLSAALAHVHEYPHGGYPELEAAIAEYADVEPENVVLGAGADDLILLTARAFAGPGDRIAVADEPTYPLFRVSAWLAGAEIGDVEPALTFCCRPHNPTGALVDVPAARPLVVDEAYHEFCGETAALLDEGVVALRTLSKAFALAGARVGYAIAGRETARELRARQSPAPISTLSAAAALASLASPPDVRPIVEERERLAVRLREIGLPPLPSSANFLYVSDARAQAISQRLLARGVVVRDYPGAIRITVLGRQANERLVEALEQTLDALGT